MKKMNIKLIMQEVSCDLVFMAIGVAVGALIKFIL